MKMLLEFRNSKEKLNTCLLGFRFPDKIGGNLPGVHYIRDVADADLLISSLVIFVCYTYPLVAQALAI